MVKFRALFGEASRHKKGQTDLFTAQNVFSSFPLRGLVWKKVLGIHGLQQKARNLVLCLHRNLLLEDNSSI
jgi:hypothetical protein